MLDPIEIQFQHFVVECGQGVLPELRELVRDFERFGFRLRLRKYECPEFIASERAWPAEDHPIEITLQRQAISFNQVCDFFMTIAEIFPIEIELRRSCATRVVTPAIRKQNAADVEKNGGDGKHDRSPAMISGMPRFDCDE